MMIHGYRNLLIIFFAATAILYLPLLVVSHKMGKRLTRQLSFLLCFWSFFLIVYATIILFGLPIAFNPPQHVLNLRPFLWLAEENIGQRLIREVIPNILIFIPFGVFVPIAFRRARKIRMLVLIAAIVPLCIETFQYFIGRSSDIDDLFVNMLGVMAGFVFYSWFHCLFKHKTWWRNLLGA